MAHQRDGGAGGEGRLQTWEEEGRIYRSGGGEALRCKRQREWEDWGWEELEVIEEEVVGAMPMREEEMGAVTKCGGHTMEDNDVNGEVMKMEGNEGKGANVENMDGGGDVGVEGGRHVKEAPDRKPLRGKRRGKRSIKKEEEAKLASTMARWLGNRPT